MLIGPDPVIVFWATRAWVGWRDVVLLLPRTRLARGAREVWSSHVKGNGGSAVVVNSVEAAIVTVFSATTG